MNKKIILILILSLISIFLNSCNDIVIPQSEPVQILNEQLLLDDNYDRFFNHVNHKKLIIKLTNKNATLLNQTMQEYFEQFGNYKSDTYIPASIYYEDSFGMIEMQDVAFRTRGNLSRTRFLDEDGNLQLNHLKLKFNAQFTTLERDGYLFGLEELDLKYNRNFDASYMNEFGALKLYDSLDVLSQKSSLVYVEVHIDNTINKIGVMTAFEPIDEWFIRRRFESKNNEIGDLYKSLWQQFGPANLTNIIEGSIGIKDADINYRPSYDLKTNKKTSNHEALNLLIDVLASNDIYYKKAFIETYVDLDQLARQFAVSLLLGNPDDIRSMANNYYLYFDIVSEKYYLFPYDLDHSLGQGWDGAPVFQNQLVDTELYHYGELFTFLSNQSNVNHPLFDIIFQLDQFKSLYETYLQTLLDTTFTFSFFKNFIDQYQSLYQQDIASSMIQLQFGYRDLESFIDNKRISVLAQLNETT